MCAHTHTDTLNTIDECDWSTPCTTGVCFANNTGCPVAGAYLLKYNQSDAWDEADPGSNYSEDNRHHHHIITLLVSAGIIVALMIGCIIAIRYRYDIVYCNNRV